MLLLLLLVVVAVVVVVVVVVFVVVVVVVVVVVIVVVVVVVVTGAQCWKYKTMQQRQSLVTEPGGSREELAAFLQTKAYDQDAAQWKAYVDLNFVDLRGVTVIPFTTKYFVQSVVAFTARGGRLWSVIDFTHDVCKQHYKLGFFGFVGFHYVKWEWRMCVLPLMFCIASKERQQQQQQRQKQQ